jgi:hypothetical protein
MEIITSKHRFLTNCKVSTRGLSYNTFIGLYYIHSLETYQFITIGNKILASIFLLPIVTRLSELYKLIDKVTITFRDLLKCQIQLT